MRRFGIILLAILLLLALVGFAAKRVLLDTASVPPRSRMVIDLGVLRGLAQAPAAELPIRINSELVGEHTVPRVAAVAGGGFGPHTMVRTAFQVVYEDGAVIIDSGMDRELAESANPAASFYAERYEAVQEGMRRAKLIVVTHEHSDHISGISRTRFPDEVLPRTVLTREQADNREQLESARFAPDALARVRVLDYDAAHRLAPGLVLIKAPGHTPGTQMIYVLLRDGREFLFVGDIVWHMDNVIQLVGRPRIVTDFLLGEDRDAVLEQIRMLHDFRRRHGDVYIVVAHDADQYRRLVHSRVIGAAFE